VITVARIRLPRTAAARVAGRTAARALIGCVLAAASMAVALGAPGPAVADEGTPLPGEAELRSEPGIMDLVAGAPVVVSVTLKTDVAVSTATVDVLFDEAKLRVTGVQLGQAYLAAMPVAAGEPGAAFDVAIAEANRTGRLAQVGVFQLPGMGELPAGENVLFTVTMDALADGQAQVALSKGVVLDATASELVVTGSAANTRQARADEATGPEGSAVAAVTIGILLLLGGLALATGGIKVRRLRDWPYLASLLLGIIPVAAFAGIVALLVVNALPALETPGINGLLATSFSSAYSLSGPTGALGLVPAAWGTVLVSVLAIALALPVSIAMAIVATEFPAGPLGRVLKPLLGVLAGIPPIVYAVAGAVFVTIFIAPKLAGSLDRTSFNPAALGVDPAAWPPADVPFTDTSFPWLANVGGLPNSTLLGAVLVALLVIPFMTPLIHDAMRNVPSAAREASFALGANRWYTVRRVLLPHAMPGIIAAVAMATLKAFGDVLILALAVGWQAEQMPVPVFDVLERTSTLAAEGANLLGNLQAGSGGACDLKGTSCPVGYSGALVLLIAAAAIVIVSGAAEARLRRRQPS
jgi:phosphate transport system permease protein